MEYSTLYAICAGGIIFSLILWRSLVFLTRLLRSSALRYHLLFPYLYRRSRFLEPLSRLRLLFLLLFWGANLLPTLININSLQDVGKRVGTLAMINLIPFFISNQLSLAADLLGISLHSYILGHGAVGFATVAEGIIHVIIKI